MTWCINPDCSKPYNTEDTLFCQACGSDLLLAERYRVIGLLSDKGAFGKTYEVLDHNSDQKSDHNTLKVLKVLTDYQSRAVELFEQEAWVLSQLNHPGIPKSEGTFIFSPRNNEISLHCMVLEYIEGLDLEEYQHQNKNHPIDETLALEWLSQLVKILHVVHQKHFFHRDIKPSNVILRKDGQLVLIDFGAVRQVTNTIIAGGKNTQIHTPGYAPPEQEQGYAMPQSDFFALGRTFVYLLTGKEPMDPLLYNPDTSELLWHPYAPHISPQLREFIDQLMAPLVSQRPRNTQEILQQLAKLEQVMNPAPSRRQVLSKILSTRFKGSSIGLSNTKLTRVLTKRKLLKAAGFGSVGLVLATVIDKLSDSPSHTLTPNPLTLNFTQEVEKDKSLSPGNQEVKARVTNVSLQDFEFDVARVNPQGQITNRNRHQGKFFKENLGNKGVMLQMVSIPGGTFTMASPASRQMVTVKPLYMGKFSVTQAQWKVVASLPKVSRELDSDPSHFKGDNLPVEQISWYDAVEFCARVSQQTGRTYRLPSEVEWEYACRAGTTTKFHFGQAITTNLANYDGHQTDTDGSQPKGIFREKTTTVGSFQVANAFGLYDMHGNVWEWCADHWHENHQGAPSDGSAWLSKNEDRDRLLRGGSWLNSSGYCHSDYRNFNAPDVTYISFGFRVVCDLI
ncbi:bifunctional serine/threonine-protein kinase/formylglycine-generating enzyme family protein [Moorena sp. SIO4G3]|uniref:bifunctional serine/threonine-protein kinase/formylglycine-generating enzyme family protein n=1 Tax=Moorena sp. SIO4G3 TaxID=2607821 RepID=UPI0025CF18E8|nr:bifunctional serine/threonine-protein kinase/formylglycine-generating enzyme family protein [Moorena sp. SIO4G3]